MSKFNKILSQIREKYDFSDEYGEMLLENLPGEDMSNYNLVKSREYDENNGSIEEWRGINLEVIKSFPGNTSDLDEFPYKVRYQYKERYSSDKSRQFCKQMMGRTNNGVVYKYEDIRDASFRGINKKFGHQGKPYSLFRYKGGPNCGHYWEEQLYELKKKPNGEYVDDKALSSSKEVNNVPGYNPNPVGKKDSVKAPKDMPRQGHHPDYGK